MGGLEEPVFAAVAAIQRNPIHGPFGKFDLLAGAASEADARDVGMLAPRTHGRSRFAKVASGKIFFIWSSAGDSPIVYLVGAWRRAGNMNLVRASSVRAYHKTQC